MTDSNANQNVFDQTLSEIYSNVNGGGGHQNNTTFGVLLKHIRTYSTSESEKGRWFENLVIKLLEHESEFEVEQVYRWNQWPERKKLTGLDGNDIGIDLVAKLESGEYVAIQCKCYSSKYHVEKKDIDSFLGASGRDPFVARWVIATCNWSGNAQKEIIQQKIPVSQIDFLKYENNSIKKQTIEQAHREPWDIQIKAIQNTVVGLSNFARGQLIMACGTGKTFTSLKIAEEVVDDGGKILFLAPSIALVSQARREWIQHTRRRLRTLLVCSDSTAGRDSEDIGLSELACRVTTDPKKISHELNKKETCVIFCTYQSLHQISIAQLSYNAPDFDLTIADEAHRTTGIDRNNQTETKSISHFQKIHDSTFLQTKKRLYMTATPRLYTLKSKKILQSRGYNAIDMSDYDVYGPVFHRLTFKEAVNAGMLSDYRVIVMGIYEDDVPPDLHDKIALVANEEGKKHIFTISDMTRLLGVSLAINGISKSTKEERPGVMSKTIGYANSIARSKIFTKALQLPELHQIIIKNAKKEQISTQHINKLQVEHLDASSNALKRNSSLRELENATKSFPKMISNVRLFTEGVDIPSLDAVVFLDPRDSQVDVVQAVGRVMRKSSGKRFGYIIVPVLIPPGKNMLDGLESDSDGYDTVGRVLRALQSHDGRLSESPLQFIQFHNVNSSTITNSEPAKIEKILGLDEFGEKFYAKVMSTSGLGNPGLLTSQDIEHVVKYASHVFVNSVNGKILAEVLGLPSNNDSRVKEACTVAALLITNACLLHRRLANVPHMAGLTDLNGIGKSHDPGSILLGAWNAILKKDYRPIFEPALKIIDVLPQVDAVNNAIKRMADCANSVADSLSDLGYDHAGPLYHRILETASSDGAFYTHNVSALMLARLALTENFTDWSDIEKVDSLRIMDPACGTGTLLMAALQTIKSRIGYDNLSKDTKISLHKSLVENVLCGLDINRHGIQLAACNLTLGAPTVDYNRMNLMTMKHGLQPDKTMKAGSLEILRAGDSGHTLQEYIRPLQSMDDLQAEHVDDTLLPTNFPISGLGLVIMNPPFTDNQKRNRKFASDIVKKMQQHELAIKKEIINNDKMTGDSINVNSISTFFTPLAHQLLNHKIGTLAMILPVTSCTSASGLPGRKFLASKFHIECIVTTHDPKRVNFSHATSIHECLIICRRHTGNNKPSTKFVSLHTMPANIKEAIKTTNEILGNSAGSFGNSYLWAAERITSGNWTPIQWYDQSLADEILELESSPLLEKMGNVYDIGPAGRRIHDAYIKCEKNDDNSVLIFDSISTAFRKTLHGIPESHHKPKSNKIKLAARYWEQRSHLLIASRFRTTNGLLTALYTDIPSVGKGWIPVNVKDELCAKGLAVWWNSTPVRMMLLNRRGKTLTYPKWSLEHLREIMIPKLDNPKWYVLRDVYEKIYNQELLPLKQGPEDPIRSIIDEAAAFVLQIKPKVIHDWCKRLSLEPTITNRYASIES